MSMVKELSIIAQELKQCSEKLETISSKLANLTSGETTNKKVETLNLEDVRKVLAEKSKLGFTSQIREIITSFDAKKLSDVNPSDYPSLLDKVKELKDE